MSSSLILSSSTDAIVVADAAPEEGPVDLTPMLDVKCAVDFILGTGMVTMRECLRLQRHSVLRLIQRSSIPVLVVPTSEA